MKYQKGSAFYLVADGRLYPCYVVAVKDKPWTDGGCDCDTCKLGVQEMTYYIPKCCGNARARRYKEDFVTDYTGYGKDGALNYHPKYASTYREALERLLGIKNEELESARRRFHNETSEVLKIKALLNAELTVQSGRATT